MGDLRCKRHHLAWTHEVHGLTQLIDRKTPSAKLFWSAVLGSCLLYAVTNTVLVTKEYIDNRTTILTTINQVSKLLFPTLVICPRTADAVRLNDLLNDILNSVDGIDNETAIALLAFAIAGTGFSNFEQVVDWMSSNEEQLYSYYEIWKANRTAEQMLTYIFEQNGYTCNEMFKACRLGSTTLDCCDIFTQTYVLLRGRCFRMNPLYQRDSDEMGKLVLYMYDLPSAIYRQFELQQQLVVYVSDQYRDVALSPHYYLGRQAWNRMRFRLKEIEMLSSNHYCSDSVYNQGRGTCFTRQWLLSRIIKPLNCTLVYLRDIFPHEPICDPLIIIQHYVNVTNAFVDKYECLPACKRLETSVQITNSQWNDKMANEHVYVIEASYTELQYESYKEIVTITLPGFVSQIGGQMGLFLGMSIITLIQLCVWFLQTLRRRFLTHRNKFNDGSS